MQQGYFYIIKDAFFEYFEKLGCSFKYNKNAARPTYCCFEDIRHKGLFWAVPTGTIKEHHMDRINHYMSCDDRDIRSSFYHIGYTNRKAIFYISSAFPIIDKYIEREYTNNGIPLVMKRMKMKDDIRRKLLRIITYANQFPNKLETKITLIKNELLKELR